MKIIIPDRLIGSRLDAAISEMLPELSRNKITTWIKSGEILIDSNPFKPKEKVIGGEIIEMNVSPEENTNWIAEDIKLNIVFEDDDILILNKPSGLVTHPGAGNTHGTLANGILFARPELNQLDRAGIVHRLDKDTSGLMVVAKTEPAKLSLIKQLESHSASREYSAIVYGSMVTGGMVDEPIGRDSVNRQKQAVKKGGKPAITHYRVIEKFKNFTLIKAILETGRTHQIRVHMSYIGHPLLGDLTYGGKVKFPKGAKEELKVAIKKFPRQALHAKKLSIIHPIDNKELSWKSNLPEDLDAMIKILREYDS
jgi:23S rRNA pseudouridine1911/1915/1917 synthase